MGSSGHFGKEKYLFEKNIPGRRCERRGANRKPGKKIVEATAYVCGLGFYEFSLNGKKVGNSEFAPLWSDYDKTVYYNTYDVTEQLRRGENVVGILLGNGFYNVQGALSQITDQLWSSHTFI